jgi:flagellar FliL protein
MAACGALVLAAGGAAAAAWITGGTVDPRVLLDRGVKPAAKAGPPHFLELEPFVVNLQDASGDRYAQVGVTLQLRDARLDPVFKEQLPAVRNQVLLLLSSKRVEDLLSAEGKLVLAQQIREQAALAVAQHPKVGEGPAVDAVLFSQFIVQ